MSINIWVHKKLSFYQLSIKYIDDRGECVKETVTQIKLSDACCIGFLIEEAVNTL